MGFPGLAHHMPSGEPAAAVLRAGLDRADQRFLSGLGAEREGFQTALAVMTGLALAGGAPGPEGPGVSDEPEG